MPSRIPSYRPPRVGTRGAARTYERRPARKADKAFYRSAAWMRLRDRVRREEPLCRLCLAAARLEPTAIVDHILPRHKFPELALVRSNLRGLCIVCNNRVRSEQSTLARGVVGDEKITLRETAP